MSIIKIILATLGVIVFIVLAAATYYFLQQNDTEPIDGSLGAFPDTQDSTDTPIGFNPFDDTQGSVSATQTPNTIEKARIRTLSNSPIVGFTSYKASGETYVRYMERGTGNIYDVTLRGGLPNVVSNKTIPNTSRVIWSNGGSSFITQQNNEGINKTTHYSFGGNNAEDISFSRTLSIGNSGESVRNLQIALNTNVQTLVAQSGVGSPGEESSYYGTLTESAVKKFQNLI